MAFRGDLIRCTVQFEDETPVDNGKVRVPVMFSLNERRVNPEDHKHKVFIEYCPGENLYPFIGMLDKDCKVLAKVNSCVLAIANEPTVQL